MIKQTDITLIIPHYGEDERACWALDQCVGSLKETCDIKIIISKNGNSPHCKHIADIETSEQGQCIATNMAVSGVKTPWIMVTNDDMIYPPGWFKRLTSFEKSDIQCISPMLIEPRDGAPTFQKQMFGGVGGDFDKQAFLDFAKNHWGKIIRTGFNLPFLITKELWDTIGGYDEQYDPWGSNSDSDLEYKIKLAGVQPYQNTNAIVYHFSNTSGTFEPRNHRYWQENFAKFERKWGFPRTDQGIWEATFDIPEPPVRKFTPLWENKYK